MPPVLAAVSARVPSQSSSPAVRDRRPFFGLKLPLLVVVLSLFLLLVPLLAWAQDPSAASTMTPSGAQAWIAVLAGLIGVISGGGSLYRAQSSANTLEARMAVLEKGHEACAANLPREFVRQPEFTRVLEQLRKEATDQRRETREDLQSVRSEVSQIRSELTSIAAQNQQILVYLRKVGADA